MARLGASLPPRPTAGSRLRDPKLWESGGNAGFISSTVLLGVSKGAIARLDYDRGDLYWPE